MALFERNKERHFLKLKHALAMLCRQTRVCEKIQRFGVQLGHALEILGSTHPLSPSIPALDGQYRPVAYPAADAISANVVSFWGRPPDVDEKMNTLICPPSPERIGYLPVRKAALFGVQIESGVTSCRKRAPCSASRSMLGVLIVSFPKHPTSAIPRSSTRNITKLGFVDVTRLNTKN